MDECIFCAIAQGTSPAEIDYQDDEIVAFRDIDPVAPVHILIIPKKHIPSINQLTEEDYPLLGKMFAVAQKLAEKNNLIEDGYRLVFNVGRQAGQMVDHLHLHLIGGKELGKIA